MEWFMTAIIVIACVGDVIITRHYTKTIIKYSNEMQNSNRVVTEMLNAVVTNAKTALEAYKDKE